MKKDSRERVEELNNVADELEMTEEDRILQELDYQEAVLEVNDFIEIVYIN